MNLTGSLIYQKVQFDLCSISCVSVKSAKCFNSIDLNIANGTSLVKGIGFKSVRDLIIRYSIFDIRFINNTNGNSLVKGIGIKSVIDELFASCYSKIQSLTIPPVAHVTTD